MKRPEKFYKYTSADTAIKILENGKLRWSSPELFNDVSEFDRMPVFSPPIEEAWPNFIREAIEIVYSEKDSNNLEIHPSASKIITMLKLLKSNGFKRDEAEEEFKECPYEQSHITSALNEHIKTNAYKNARIFCLTTDPNNEVMWGYYADGSSGCVLGFRHLPELDTPFLEARQIKYTEGNPVIADGRDFILQGDTPALRKATLDAICYTKSINWIHENEWRVITWPKFNNNAGFTDYKFWPNELESITFGAKLGSNEESRIREIVSQKYPHCSFYKIRSVNGNLSKVQLHG